MPVIESQLDCHSADFAQNRETMLAGIAQLRQLEQLLPREHLNLLLDPDTLWLQGQSGAIQIINLTCAVVSSRISTCSGTLNAPIDGTIVDVLISKGATASKGQLVLVLEAMKMEHPLKAGIDGVVLRLQVMQGDQVKNRQVLLEVAPSGAPD